MNHRTVLGLKLATASVGFLALTIVSAMGLRAITGYADNRKHAVPKAELNAPDREPASSQNASKNASKTLVFESVSTLNSAELGLISSSPQIRGRKVRVHFENLIDLENPRPRRVVLNLFPDAVLDVVLQAPSVYGVNSGLLVGLVQDDPESFVRMMIQNGVMDGTIRTRGREFRVFDGGNGLHIVTEAPAPALADK